MFDMGQFKAWTAQTLLESTNFSATNLDDIEEKSDDVQQSLKPLISMFAIPIIGICFSLIVLFLEVIQVRMYGIPPKKSHRRKLRYVNGVKRFYP